MLVRASLLLGLLFGLQAIAIAEMTRIGTLPQRRRAAGYSLKVSMETLGGNGYHPFQLEFSPRGKGFVRDHNVEVFIRPSRTYGSSLDLTFRQSFKLDEGSPGQTFVAYVPSYIPWDAVIITLHEDGEQVETGRSSYGLSMNQRPLQQHVSVGVIVRSGKKASAAWEVTPDVRTLTTVLGTGPINEATETKRLSDSKSRAMLLNVQPAWVQFRVISEDNQYKNWLAYSQLDVIIVAAPILERIRTGQAEQYDALRKWVAAGGTMWVYATDAEPDPFGETLTTEPADPKRIVKKGSVTRLMNLQTQNDTSELSSEYWNGVKKMSQMGGQRNFRSRREVFNEMKADKNPFVEIVASQKISDRLRVARLGLGKVIMIKDEDPFPGSFQFWYSVHQLSSDITWADRFGVDIPCGNDNYWSWLIPSVGQPPVKSFVVLNILFALLIGPLCYFFFRRRQRLYLLYFAAPMLALLVSGSLFVYAIGSDGFSTRVRARQISWVDPSSDFMIEQSRQTYFAAAGNSDGLSQSRETVVCPVHGTPLVRDYYQQSSNFRPGEVIVDSDKPHARMTGNLLPPRDQVQYLTTRPIASEQTVLFETTDGKPTITNNLDHPITQIILRDKQGAYWIAGQVQQSQATSMTASSQNEARKALLSKVMAKASEVPLLQSNTRFSRRFVTGMEVSQLESKLDRWSAKGLPKGAFLALVPVSEDRLGVNDPIVLDSHHVVMGYFDDGGAK